MSTADVQVQSSRAACAARYGATLVGPEWAPVVLALGGISADRNVTTAWWSDIAGEGCAIDTTTRRVLGVDFLDGGRAASGKPAKNVTTHDQAAHIVDLLDALEIERLHAVVGASYGGMVALALAERCPERVGRLVVISAGHEPHPMATGLRAVQRRVVELGLATGRVDEAMALGRAVAMTTYRSAGEFAERFTATPTLTDERVEFDVERYLLHAGARFAERMKPERFLALSLSIDLHRVTPENISVPVTGVIAATDDAIAPEAQLAAMAARFPQLEAYHVITTRFGHDAFLTEPEQVSRLLSAALPN